MTLPRFYRELETGDYLMAYARQRAEAGFRYTVRATAFAGHPATLMSQDVDGAYLRQCRVVDPDQLPPPWRQEFHRFLHQHIH